jgi:hypothetical protein
MGTFVNGNRLIIEDALKYNAEVYGFDAEETKRIEAMNPEERQKVLISLLEGRGCIVLTKDDVNVITEDPKALKEKSKKAKEEVETVEAEEVNNEDMPY